MRRQDKGRETRYNKGFRPGKNWRCSAAERVNDGANLGSVCELSLETLVLDIHGDTQNLLLVLVWEKLGYGPNRCVGNDLERV